MAWTDADLVKIRAAISTGVRSVTFADGRKTEYHSLDQMMAAEKVMAAQVQMQAQTLAGKGRSRTPYFKTGL